jgi:hypothetical protein
MEWWPGLGTEIRLAMRFEDGHWVCTWCGAVVDVPVHKRLVEKLRGRAGGPGSRVITVDGDTVHECATRSGLAMPGDAA